MKDSTVRGKVAEKRRTLNTKRKNEAESEFFFVKV
jgi:hypothetical protein